MITGSFELLSPGDVVHAVERAFAIVLDGTLDSYPSYVNRVYGMRGMTGRRSSPSSTGPGRWTGEAILDEHRFLRDLADAEIPVIAPLPGADGGTLQEIAEPGTAPARSSSSPCSRGLGAARSSRKPTTICCGSGRSWAGATPSAPRGTAPTAWSASRRD